MVFIRAILAAAVCVALSTASPVEKRQAIEAKDPCRHEGLFVGGTVVGDGKYVEQVKTEAECIQKCHDLPHCQAINYFPNHQACLPQAEPFQGANVDLLATQPTENTVYVIVKNCAGDAQNPENNRKKRQAIAEGCRLENVHVGGEVAGKGEYISDVPSEDACVEECKNLDDCTAVTFWPGFGDCLPQIQSLADPEFKDRLSSRVSTGAIYIVVKGCTGDLQVPENILPEVEDGQSGESSTEASASAESSGQGSDETSPEPQDSDDDQETNRRKRQVACRTENFLVGGFIVGDDLKKYESEAACVKACEELDKCQAVNYFPDHRICWQQSESLITDGDYLEKREEEGVTYIIVKGCGGGSTSDPQEGEDETEQPDDTPEPTGDEEDGPEPPPGPGIQNNPEGMAEETRHG